MHANLSLYALVPTNAPNLLRTQYLIYYNIFYYNSSRTGAPSVYMLSPQIRLLAWRLVSTRGSFKAAYISSFKAAYTSCIHK
jgi:hypothetical protein